MKLYLMSGLNEFTPFHHSSYLCRRVLPLIDCEVEQVLGGSTEAQETSDAGALFKVSKLLVKLRNVETWSDF